MRFPAIHLLDTNPRWLSLTLLSSAVALSVTGLGVLLGVTDLSTIGPFTLLLHLVWAIALAAWVLNIKTNMAPDKRIILAIGPPIAMGSAWSSMQQWFAYLSAGQAFDILLIVGAMVMDVAGGAAAYFFYRFNILKK